MMNLIRFFDLFCASVEKNLNKPELCFIAPSGGAVHRGEYTHYTKLSGLSDEKKRSFAKELLLIGAYLESTSINFEYKKQGSARGFSPVIEMDIPDEEKEGYFQLHKNVIGLDDGLVCGNI